LLRDDAGSLYPLQLKFVADVSRGVANSATALVNACDSDCVNVVLYRLDFRTTCGIGNSAIVEAFCRSHPSVGNKRDSEGGAALSPGNKISISFIPLERVRTRNVTETIQGVDHGKSRRH
jgi:hypothetical protein